MRFLGLKINMWVLRTRLYDYHMQVLILYHSDGGIQHVLNQTAQLVHISPTSK